MTTCKFLSPEAAVLLVSIKHDDLKCAVIMQTYFNDSQQLLFRMIHALCRSIPIRSRHQCFV